MIFVTLGTHRTPFPRLVDWMERWQETHPDHPPVVMQTGYTPCEASQCEWVPFLSPAEMEQRMRAASVVVGHAGVGTIMGALMAGTPIIVVPRRPQNGEHLDGHQVELAQRLEAMGLIRVAEDEAALARHLGTAPAPVALPGAGRLLDHLRRRIDDLASQAGSGASS